MRPVQLSARKTTRSMSSVGVTRRDGLRAVATGVVEQNDVSAQIRILGMHGCQRALDDRINSWQGPIHRIDMHSDRYVTEILRYLDGIEVGFVRRLGVAEIGWTEQTKRSSGERLEQA